MMQARTIDDAGMLAFLKALRERIYALGLVHQQLMTSRDLQTFDLAPFFQVLTENLVLASSQGEIELEVDASPLTVDLDYAVPMALIITELVTNSVKHGLQKKGGKIEVVVRPSTEAEDSEIMIMVADNGRGETVDTQSPPKAGIGRKLVEGLLKQLKGRMIIEDGAGFTTKFFPPPPRKA